MEQRKRIRIVSMVASPTGKFSNTYRIHRRILAEARRFYPDIDETTIFFNEKQINPATGCITCLRKGYCPQQDDVAAIQAEVAASDGVIFGTPVYMMHVSAQAKAFLDRCLGWAHRPVLQGKYVLNVASGLGLGADVVTGYLAQVWTTFGAQVVGHVEGQAIIKGVWLNQAELADQSRAMAQELVSAIVEQRQYPVPEYERERFGRFRTLINMPMVGAKLFTADQEFWRRKEQGGDGA